MAATGAVATDIEAGKAVVVGAGLSDRKAACLACHGLNGAGDGSGAFPRITGQPGWYLYKQLKDYAAGNRPNPIMTPVAQALSEQQAQDVAAYYAAQQAPYAPAPEVEGTQLQHGAALSAVGDPQKAIQSCVSCHGAAGIGMPPSGPVLAGQYARYTQLQLELWQRDERRNDPLDVMKIVAKQMTPEDVRAVSLYFESVRPPVPSVQAADRDP